MPAIVTVTMNPAVDLWTATARVSDTHKLRCEAAQRHPGGGGINVARVVQRLGADCLALYPAGGVTGQLLRQMLDAEQVRGHCIPITGETRESFSVREQSSGRDFRFVLPGPELADSEWQACLDWIDALPQAPRWLVASGSLPPGVPADFYARLAHGARVRGGWLVLDTSGPALASALAEGVYLVKPSLRELRELVGQPLDDTAQQLQAARALVQRGQAQVVALSLGEAGAMLVSAQGAWRAPAVAVTVASTIGAGDSFVAGLVWALDRGDGMAQALQLGMGAAAAALLTAGTALCQPADVQRLSAGVAVTAL